MAYEFSIMTDDREHCYICGGKAVQIHHVFGASNRQHATDDGLWIPVCLNCHIRIHNDYPTRRSLMMDGQWKYEETHTHGDFMKRYGRNYL